MTNKMQLAKWRRIRDPYKALAEISEHEDVLGYDPYYADLRKGLLDMAERIAETQPK